MITHERRRLLFLALAISVVLHGVFVPLALHPRTVDADVPPEILAVERIATPPPRVRPTATPMRHHAAVLPHVPFPRMVRPLAAAHRYTSHAVPRTHMIAATGTTAMGTPSNGDAAGGSGIGAGADTGGAAADETVPAASPRPVPTATPATCTRPEVDAETVRAAAPEMPALAEAEGVRGDVDVVVSLDAQSRLTNVRVQRSASAVLNAAALAAARASVFRTAVHDCAPVAADYVFSVEFSAN